MTFKIITDEEMPQRSPAWLRFRSKYITASNAGIIFGKPYRGSKRQTWEDLRIFGEEKIEMNSSMQWGVDHEDEARSHFNNTYETDCQPSFVYSEDQMVGASLDGYDPDKSVLVELKCPPEGASSVLWIDTSFGNLPEYYFWQVVHQQLIVDADHIYFSIYDAKRKVSSEVDWTRDAIQGHVDFYAEQITNFLNGEPQPGDYGRNVEAIEIENEYLATKESIARLKKQETALKKKLLKYAGHNRLIGAGIKGSIVNSNKVDYKSMLNDNPSIDVKKYTTTSQSWRITARGES